MNDDAMTFCDVDYILGGMSAVVEENVVKGGRSQAHAPADAAARIRRQARRPGRQQNTLPACGWRSSSSGGKPRRADVITSTSSDSPAKTQLVGCVTGRRIVRSNSPAGLYRRTSPAPQTAAQSPPSVSTHIPSTKPISGGNPSSTMRRRFAERAAREVERRTRRCLPRASRRSRTSRRPGSSPSRSRARRPRGRGAPDRRARGSRARRRPPPRARPRSPRPFRPTAVPARRTSRRS